MVNNNFKEIFKQKVIYSLNNNKKLEICIYSNIKIFDLLQNFLSDLEELYNKNLLESIKIIINYQEIKNYETILNELNLIFCSINQNFLTFINKLIQENIFQLRILYHNEINYNIIYFKNKILNEIKYDIYFLQCLSKVIDNDIYVFKINILDNEEIILFFDNLWNRSSRNLIFNQTEDIIYKIVKNKYHQIEPRIFFSILLNKLKKEYLIKNISNDLSNLQEFKNISYYIVLEKLNTYNFCILPNSLGFNRNYISLLISKFFIEKNKKVLIIYQNYFKNNWEYDIKSSNISNQYINFFNNKELNNKIEIDNFKQYDLIIVDDYKYYLSKNKESLIYKNLHNILTINKQSKVLLLSDTIINKSFLDLYSVINLFYQKNSNLFPSTYSNILNNVLNNINNLSLDYINTINDLKRNFFIHIDWTDNKNNLNNHYNIENESSEKSVVTSVRYAYDHEISVKIFDKLVDFIGNLSFDYMKLCNNNLSIDNYSIFFYKYNIFKKIESSIISFKNSLKELLEKNKIIKKIINLEPVTENVYYNKENIDMINNNYNLLSRDKQIEINNNINKDISLIESMVSQIEQIRYFENRDEKIKDLLKTLNMEKGPTIIYTESNDTAYYIEKKLIDYGKTKVRAFTYDNYTIDEFSNNNGEYILEEIESKFNNGEIDILILTDVLGKNFHFKRVDNIINFDSTYNIIKLLQRNINSVKNNYRKKIKIFNFIPDKRIDKEMNLLEKYSPDIENIISIGNLDFILYAINEKLINDTNINNKEKICFLLRDYKEYLSKKNFEDYINYKFPIFSQIDLALREFIKYYNISIETIDLFNYNVKKPLYISLIGNKDDYFIIFKYNKNIYTINKFTFSDKIINSSLNDEDDTNINNLIINKINELKILDNENNRDENFKYEIIAIVKYIKKLNE